MRGRKIILGIMLATMVLSSAAAVIFQRQPNVDNQQVLQSRLAELKARLNSAIKAAELDAGGKAISVRLDESSSKPRWVIVVDAAGKKRDVVVDETGSIISTTDHVELPTTRPTDTEGSTAVPTPGTPDTGAAEHK